MDTKYFLHHNPIYTGRAVSGLWQFQQVWRFQQVQKNFGQKKIFKNKKNKK
tara:strand:+ start:24 stop:176 length:153 start_codon:yes stop_codon:yes gene_type:complete